MFDRVHFMCPLLSRLIERKHYQSSVCVWTLLLSQGILERLNAGEVVIGDGGFVFALEKRGYVKAGPWTPEAAVTHPEAGETEGT